MKNKNLLSSNNNNENEKNNNLGIPKFLTPSPSQASLKSLNLSHYDFERVSDWFDADGIRIFIRLVRSGDIVEVRNTRCSHFGVAIRVPLPQTPKEISKKRAPTDEIMVYHLIHGGIQRGQIGKFILEDIWPPTSKIRINNTTNGASIYGNLNIIPKTEILNRALIAHNSTKLKWQTCSEFVRWTCEQMFEQQQPQIIVTNTSSETDTD